MPLAATRSRRKKRTTKEHHALRLELQLRTLRCTFEDLPKRQSHVYIIRDPQGGIYKIGESSWGIRLYDKASIRAESQVRDLNRIAGPGYVSEIRKIFPNKRAAQRYEVRLIRRFRRFFGENTLPGNQLNR